MTLPDNMKQFSGLYEAIKLDDDLFIADPVESAE